MQSSGQPHEGRIAADRGTNANRDTQQTAGPTTIPFLYSESTTPGSHEGGESGGYWPPSSEWALVYVTVFLAIYTAKLWKATVELAKDAKLASAEQSRRTDASIKEAVRAADAMHAQVAKTDEIAQRQLRAYISVVPEAVSKWAVGEIVEIAFCIKNHGETPGSGIAHFYAITVIPVPKFGTKVEVTLPFQEYDQANTLFPHSESTVKVKSNWILSHDDDAAVRSGAKQCHLWGFTRYRDAFGNEQKTKIAFSFDGTHFGNAAKERSVEFWYFGLTHNDAT